MKRTIRAALLILPLLVCGCASSALLVPEQQVSDIGRRMLEAAETEK